MKYIKKFESFCVREDYVYYTIHINGSWEKFLFALDELDIREDFFNSWDIEEYDDLREDHKKILNSDPIILLIVSFNDDVVAYYIRKNIEDVRKDFDFVEKIASVTKVKNFIDGGDIHVTDEDVSAKKYNL